MYRYGIRVIEPCGGLCFTNEPVHATFVVGKISGQNFQCDFAIKLRVLRQVNFAHPAFADFRDDAIVRDL